MVEGIEIRRAGVDDAELISDLSNITFIETYRNSCPDEHLFDFLNSYFNKEAILQELSNPDDLYFLAFYDGFPAGYLRMKEEHNDFPAMNAFNSIEIKRIYVLKEFHSKKIGSALMKHALDVATEKGYEKIWLGVWENNQKAKSFYNKWGYIDSGVKHVFSIGDTPQYDHWLIKDLPHVTQPSP